MIRDILESYEELTVDEELSDDICLFSLYGKQFAFGAPNKREPSSRPVILLRNDTGLDIPHIMLKEFTISTGKRLPEGSYRFICLYEHESVVFSMISFEDKIYDAIDRLIKLLTMNPTEREHEFQKEFMFYWNCQADNKQQYNIYLSNDLQFSNMLLFFGKKSIRIIEDGLDLNDIHDRNNTELEWTQHLETDVYHIPIADNRGILPPHRGYEWTAQSIRNIVYGLQIEHIEENVYHQLAEIKPKRQNIILVFSMRTTQSFATFAVLIKCNNVGGHTLLERLKNDIVSVEPLYTERRDYRYLNRMIGNDSALLNKRVLLIGAGSLGSYISFELVKNGVSNIKIFDGDTLEEENILRWSYGGIGKGTSKAGCLNILLKNLHPEIHVATVDENIDCAILAKEALQSDLIIFTIGNSDSQLSFNSQLKAIGCTVPVIYTWLESGGVYSHILVVDYQKPGCFECLFTDENGEPTNNRASKSTEIENSIIQNGCGGTRAAYGTSILLRTTSALLDTLSQLFSNQIFSNVLIDISPEKREISEVRFPQEACKCCGDQSSK